MRKRLLAMGHRTFMLISKLAVLHRCAVPNNREKHMTQLLPLSLRLSISLKHTHWTEQLRGGWPGLPLYLHERCLPRFPIPDSQVTVGTIHPVASSVTPILSLQTECCPPRCTDGAVPY